ncbi:hypothetical protein ACFLZG_02930 [Thermodesulfobacteriota bacterium]
MNTSTAPASLPRRIIKWLLWLLCAFLLVIFLLSGTLFILPGVISTEWFKQRLEQRVSQVLQRRVHLEYLNCAWSKGIQIKGLQIDDDPTFSNKHLVRLESFLLVIDLEQILRRCLVFDLELDGLDTQLIRNHDGETNLGLLLSRFKRPGKPESKPESGQKGISDFFLTIPKDIQGRVRAKNMSVQMRDHIRDHLFTAHDISFLLQTPSMLKKPITMRLSMEEEIDGTAIPPVNLVAEIQNLVNPEGLLNLDKTAIKIKGSIPGVRIDLKGEGDGLTLKVNVQLDPSPLMVAAQPFFATTLPEASGNIKINLDISGKSRETITFAVRMIGTDLVASGGPLKENRFGPARLTATHEGILYLPERTLEIKTGEIHIQDNIRMSWNGTLKQPNDSDLLANLSIKSLYLDLEELDGLSKNMLPSGVILPEISGVVEIGSDISGNPRETITFAIRMIGTDLVASGGPLKENGLGPVRFTATHEGILDLPGRTLEIKTGEIYIQDDIRLSWNGTLRQPNDSDPLADVTIGPVSIDLEEAYALAEVFIPSGFSIYPEGKEGPPDEQSGYADESSFGLQVKEIRIKGPIFSGTGQAQLDGLSLTLPHIRVNTQTGSLSGDMVDFQVQEGNFFLESAFPVKANLLAGLDIRNVHIHAGDEIHLERINLQSFNLTATDIIASQKALFGVGAKVVLDESVTLNGVTVPSRAVVPELSHSLKAECVLNNGPSAIINVKNLSVSAPFLSIEGFSQGPIETAIDLDSEMTGLYVQGMNPPRVNIQKVWTRLDMGKLLRTSINANVRDLGSESLNLRGKIEIDVGKMSSLFPYGLMSGIDLEGAVEVEWEFIGRLPGKKDISLLTQEDVPLPERLRKTGFLKKLDVAVSLNNLGAKLIFQENFPLKVSLIRSATPLKLTLNDGLKHGKIYGEIDFGRIDELPSLGKLEKPIRLSVSFSCDQEDLRTLNFSETIRMDQLNLNQSARISLDNIDQLLAYGLQSTLPILLEKVKGFAIGKVQADLDSDLNNYMDWLSLKGRLEAGAEIYLAGGKEVKINTRLESPGLDVSIGSGIQISNLQCHINLEKGYALTHLDDNDSPEKVASRPLSMQVLNPGKNPQTSFNTWNSTVRRIMDDLRGRLAPHRSLSFDSARIQVGPVPFQSYNNEFEFRLVEDLPYIDYFRMDLMGGSIIGYLYVSNRDKAFMLEASCALSGLDANRLLPGTIEGVPDEETELSGQISLRLPLSKDTRQMLQDLLLNVDLTHIGSRALERFLYAMDPYESNEAIVRQRNLLRMGTPRWIKLKIRHGNLSLTGQVEAKGILVDLPRIDRFNLTDLPIHRQLEESLSNLASIIELMKNISADSIYLGNDGIIRFGDKE